MVIRQVAFGTIQQTESWGGGIARQSSVMKRIEKILLSKVPVWIVVAMLALGAAGTVVFGALVEHTATRKAKNLDTRPFPALGRVAIGIARIPENLHRLLFGPHPAEAGRQRFDGQAGLDFADTAHLSGGGGGIPVPCEISSEADAR